MTSVEPPEEGAAAGFIASYNQWIMRHDRLSVGWHVDEDQYWHLRSKLTSKECWQALKAHHEKDSLGNKVSLMYRICEKKI